MNDIKIACRKCKEYLDIGDSCSEYVEDETAPGGLRHTYDTNIYMLMSKKGRDTFHRFFKKHAFHDVVLTSLADGVKYGRELNRMTDFELSSN